MTSNNSSSIGVRKRRQPTTASAAAAAMDPLSLTRLAVVRMSGEGSKSRDCGQGGSVEAGGEGICADPIHGHSFQPSVFVPFSSVRSCGMCGGRLSGLFRIGNAAAPRGDSAEAGEVAEGAGAAGGRLVKCAACGIYAHRHCAFRSYARHCAALQTDPTGIGNVQVCPANGPFIATLERGEEDGVFVTEDLEEDAEKQDERNGLTLTPVKVRAVLATFLKEEEEEESINPDLQVEAPSFLARLGSGLEGTWLSPRPFASNEKIILDADGGEDAVEPLADANDQITSKPSTTSADVVDNENDTPVAAEGAASTEAEAGVDGAEVSNPEKEPIVPFGQPFASVARAIQENVLPFFLGGPQQLDDSIEGKDSADHYDDKGGSNDNSVQENHGNNLDKDAIAAVASNLAGVSFHEEEEDLNPSPPQEDVAGILTEIDPKPPPDPSAPPPSTLRVAYDVVQTTRRTRSNMAIASVAGTIAGGVAGLALAGPAGAFILGKAFQTAGALTVLLDGTMSVGVMVAGAAAAKFAVEQAQDGSRMLALGGGKEGSRAVMLVRPNIVVDECWGEYCDEAKRSHPTIFVNGKRGITGAGFLANHQAKIADMAKQRRNEVDTDIVESNEHEIATIDKVFLIVSRSLNDRLSLPGHVHSKLIQNYKERSDDRKTKADELDVDGTSRLENMEEVGIESQPSREGRRDAHGVIKHVTATLLEVRPGLGSTPRLTELTATAVERLVFGELYEDVYEEIAEGSASIDEALMKKMYEFEMEHRATRESDSDEQKGVKRGGYPISQDDISIGALEALLSLPEARTPADKLDLCVRFLEEMSRHFDNARNRSKAMSADYLLKMVCEHIIVSKVPRLNAELAFLEEFARDEQLLRGKEGYSLVTLQASLHFLNASKDFNADIFQLEEE